MREQEEEEKKKSAAPSSSLEEPVRTGFSCRTKMHKKNKKEGRRTRKNRHRHKTAAADNETTVTCTIAELRLCVSVRPSAWVVSLKREKKEGFLLPFYYLFSFLTEAKARDAIRHTGIYAESERKEKIGKNSSASSLNTNNKRKRIKHF